ncbi:hypothetical protein [Kribbella sp. NPDC003557]|uniref:hypothetical protein n=1 Tax=Kribbella sp. NPDC003557 TaxID=3154449 RepID=UPI0033ABF3C5
MRIYRAGWLSLCGIVGVLGLIVAFTWSLTVMIMVLVCAVLTGWGVAVVALDPEDTTRLPRDKRRIAARSAGLTGAGALAFIGIGTLLGAPTAVLLLVAMAGGSPYVISHCVHWLREHGHLSEPAPQPTPPSPGDRSSLSIPARERNDLPAPPVVASALTDDDLCLAWRASFSALQRAGSPAQRLRIIEERRTYLDEIERRNAHGLAAWLASGPRAAGDPTRYVLGDGAVGRARIDWNALLHDTDQ